MVWLRSAPLVVVMLAATVGYMASLARYILGHDHGEYVMTGTEGGAPHPPGYPLYVLWLRLWSWIPLDAVLRSSLASAVLGLAAILLLYRAARSFRISPPASALAVALFAFSPRVWQIHTHAENLSLNSLIAAGILWVVAAPLAPALRLGLLGLLAGWGASNHHLLALMAPVWLWGVGRSCKKAGWGWLLVGLVMGLLPYASTVVIARSPGDRWVWGELTCVEDLVSYLLRLEYGSFQLTPQLDARQVGPAEQLLAQVRRIGSDLLWLPALVGYMAAMLALGGAVASRRLWGQGSVALSFLLSGPGLMLINRTPPEALGGLLVGRLDQQAEMLLCLLVAWAVDKGVRRLGGAAWRVRWVLPVMALLGAPRSLERAREAYRPTVQLYLVNLLETLPPGAVVIGGDDLHLFGLLYLQRIEHKRSDIVHIAPTMLFRPWYAARIARALGAPPEGVTARGIVMTHLIASLMARGRPVFLLDADDNYNEVLERFPNYPEGVTIRLLAPGSTPPETAQIEALNEALFARYTLEDRPPERGSFGARIVRDYARPWRFLAAEYGEQQRSAEVARMEARARSFEPLSIPLGPPEEVARSNVNYR
ncbi:MAG: DUF2723 domain-containing protein [Myxococcales bacterium]|nr:DUF2723 domain-containing protein [Polyangiaceae bacterium]MDW8251598.1 DUF2723 domain-containing protein [Myxococcales bacterium]